MDESLQFSEDDVRQQLDALGYHNIPTAQLRQFAQGHFSFILLLIPFDTNLWHDP